VSCCLKKKKKISLFLLHSNINCKGEGEELEGIWIIAVIWRGRRGE
jgi:hypothetical protein